MDSPTKRPQIKVQDILQSIRHVHNFTLKWVKIFSERGLSTISSCKIMPLDSSRNWVKISTGLVLVWYFLISMFWEARPPVPCLQKTRLICQYQYKLLRNGILATCTRHIIYQGPGSSVSVCCADTVHLEPEATVWCPCSGIQIWYTASLLSVMWRRRLLSLFTDREFNFSWKRSSSRDSGLPL